MQEKKTVDLNEKKIMTTYIFKFYKNDKHIVSKTFNAETIEDAYQMADNFLKQNRSLDDWEYVDKSA